MNKKLQEYYLHGWHALDAGFRFFVGGGWWTGEGVATSTVDILKSSSDNQD